MPSISPDSPKRDILALIADIKSAEAQGLAPEQVFPATNLDETVSVDEATPLIEFEEEIVDDYKPSRFRNVSSKIGLMVIGGAIYAAGAYSEEISTVLTQESSVTPRTASDGNSIKIAESPSAQPSPSTASSPASLSLESSSPKPSPVPSPKPVVPTFSQAKFGKAKQYTVIENDFNIIAKDVSRISHEDHKPLTIARFNGIKDPRIVKTGDKLTYRDCPTNGIMVNVDDTVSEIAEKYGTTTAKLHELNGGAARAVAGWCIRLKLVTTESYPTNPVRK